MKYYIGCDAHKKYSYFVVLKEDGQVVKEVKVFHRLGAIRDFLSHFPPQTPVALETVGNWYWIADEIEGAGCQLLLAHAAKTKVLMGKTNKTDKLDAKAVAMLVRNGTLPDVWFPPLR